MRKHNILTVVALTLLAALGACSRKADTKPLDAAGVRYSVITKLEEMNVSANEVANVARAKDTGLSDEACLELVRLSRSRGGEFNEGDAVGVLAGVQFTEDEVMTLARQNQLGLWVGEVQAMRLAGVSKPVILALARERSKARPSISSPNIVRLQDSGLSDNQIIELIESGTTDSAAGALARERMPKGPSKFQRLR